MQVGGEKRAVVRRPETSRQEFAGLPVDIILRLGYVTCVAGTMNDKRETRMVTAILMVFAVLLLVSVVAMFVQAVWGEFFATVWFCFGGFSGACEVLGTLLVAIVARLTGND